MTRLLRRLMHELGNGRALENAHRELHRAALAEARIDALGRRLAPALRAAA